MIEVTLNRKSLDSWEAGISRKFRKNLEVAQGEIRRGWQIELFRQQRSSGDGTWQALSPSYKKRKSAEKNAGKIPFNSVLRRTGVMLKGYIEGIRFETSRTQVSVVMPFPENTLGDNTVTVRAKTHQGFERAGSPLPIRAFNIEKFKEIADEKFNEAMKKSTQ